MREKGRENREKNTVTKQQLVDRKKAAPSGVPYSAAATFPPLIRVGDALPSQLLISAASAARFHATEFDLNCTAVTAVCFLGQT